MNLVKSIQSDPPIRKLYQEASEKAKLLKFIGDWLIREPLISGVDQVRKFDQGHLAVLEAEIARTIIQYPITYPELEYIFDNGLRAVYNEVPVFNAKNVRIWIEKYMEERKEKIKMLQYQEDEPRPEPTEKEKAELKEANRRLFIERITRLRESYGKAITLEHIPDNIDMGNLWYNRFNAAGYITYSKNERQVLLDDYIDQVRKEISGSGVIMSEYDILSRAKYKAKNHCLRYEISEFIKAGIDFDVLTKELI